ncbi:MAG: MerR family transcriptional regulator, partial [Proteobacteria bacterium]|nr:MerR family transcriptional regulator [Pseudomonadota bacterium]
MISSKELIDKTGISRATLNNYISHGLVEKPIVQRPNLNISFAKQMGFFPDSTLARIQDIHRLKKEGLSMDKIIKQLRSQAVVEESPAVLPEQADVSPAVPIPVR